MEETDMDVIEFYRFYDVLMALVSRTGAVYFLIFRLLLLSLFF